jgi:hypothetical protein
LAELDDFADGAWQKKHPAIAQSWRRNWPEVIPFFAFPDEVHWIIYTTDEIDKPVFTSRDIFSRHGQPRGKEPGTRMQALPRLLFGKDMLDMGSDRGLPRVRPGGSGRHRPLGKLLAVDTADQHPLTQQFLVLF